MTTYGNFTQLSSNPIFPSNKTFSCFLKVGSTYHAYYYNTGTLAIGHATSPDGFTWIDDTANNPITITGRNVSVISVWVEGSTWYALFNRSDGIGLATSTDGITWTSEATNPVLPKGTGSEWDNDSSLEPWGIMKVGSTYYLYYNTLGTSPRKIGIATSTDLLTWTKNSANPVWDSGRFCMFAFKYEGLYFALVPHYTSGTDYSEIEIYKDNSPFFSSKEYLGSAMSVGASGTWNDTDQDTPSVLTDNINRDSFALTNGAVWMYFSGNDGSVWREGLAISLDFIYNRTGSIGTKWINKNYPNSYGLIAEKTKPSKQPSLTWKQKNIKHSVWSP